MNDFERFINYVKDKTGIEVVITEFKSGSVFDGSAEQILSDSAANKTVFILNVKGKKAIGEIVGAGDAEKKFAALISGLSDNFFQKEVLSKTEFFKALLLGEINYKNTAKYSAKFSLPLAPCFVMIFDLPSGSLSEIKPVVVNYGDDTEDAFIALGEKECALIKFCDRYTEEYRSEGDYAEYLLQSIYEETGRTPVIYLGGKVKNLYELSESFRQALAAKSFSKRAGAVGKIHSYKEYVIYSILEDLPGQKLKEYSDVLTNENAKEIFGDQEMVSTAEEFLNCSLNVSETARNLYLHRNTLTYRLDKIEKATGLNIRKFPDAVTFRLISYINKIL